MTARGTIRLPSGQIQRQLVFPLGRSSRQSSSHHTGRPVVLKRWLVLLNQPITWAAPEYMKDLWAASTIVCDGAANRLYDRESLSSEDGTVTPEVIVGDMDSIRPEVKDHYTEAGTRMVVDTDEDCTDFDKAVKYVVNAVKNQAKEGTVGAKPVLHHEIIVWCSMEGRFDHVMGSLNTLLNSTEQYNSGQAREDGLPGPDDFMLDMHLINSQAWHAICRPNEITQFCLRGANWQGIKCGLIPVFGAVHDVITHGFKYNLRGRDMNFGGLISTSNEFDLPEPEMDSDGEQYTHVTVECQQYLLFTTSLPESFQADPSGPLKNR
eukprot:Clim_evm15s13 gene=Clim_evmTU15s13